MDKYKLLTLRLGISSANLKSALTHYSFYESKNELKGNGRFVFAGMYAFKGEVSKIILEYISGSGTQLQHLLGNVFSNDRLHKIFDELELMSLVKAGEKFDIKKHKHIFVFGLLGCVMLKSDKPETLRKIIMKYFLNDSELLNTGNNSNKKNYRGIADNLAKQFYGKPLILDIEKQDEIYHAKVSVKEGALISEASSKSYKYVRNKAFKISIRILSEKLAEPFENNNEYQKRQIEKQERKENERKLKIQQKIDEKKKSSIEREAKRKIIAAAKDLAQKKAKAEQKKRKQERATMLAWKAAKQQNISSKKRRYLEDKKK